MKFFSILNNFFINKNFFFIIDGVLIIENWKGAKVSQIFNSNFIGPFDII